VGSGTGADRRPKRAQPPAKISRIFRRSATPEPLASLAGMVASMISAPAATRPVSSIIPVTADIARLRVVMVNVYFVGDPSSSDWSWVLVDAGLPRSAGPIMRAAAERFGRDAKPRAIVLTHGHFDHVGALTDLAAAWPDVPIYAHELELPYLTGKSSYPPPDPTVGGGLMARLSPLYPKHPIDLSGRIFALPSDGTIPAMPDWRWVHTPGHSPGHVSLFRESDRALIAGDAFVTTKQESLWAVLTQRQELHGPPMYFTSDWEAARRSVQTLEELKPSVAATGHGVPIRGPALTHGLHRLARNFDRLAVPADGRYVRHPAISDKTGVVEVPPAVPTSPLLKLAAGAGVAFAMAAVINAVRHHSAQELEEDDEDFIRHGA
jgi:glyoxylase-like metal-dependent hydrolase (beta-lactamase superfamily II)